jgi:hypothetical protein
VSPRHVYFSMPRYGEEEIAALLRLLSLPPGGWVQAAKELPQARAETDDLVTRAEDDAAFRAQVLADLEAALEAEGVQWTPSAVASVRARLTGD